MKSLDHYDTVRLLIPKLWQHKDIPKQKDESILDYSKRVFANQCGIDLEYMTDSDVARIWVKFADEIFERSDYRQFMELTTFGRFLDRYEPVRAIIAIIQGMKVQGKFELDESDISKIR
jgi:hypothetical protein